ncbi:MAG: hypothetical protein IJI57_10350 [Flexilinea sp.]|nr:hypothetical protein [Flexilinea sp.]
MVNVVENITNNVVPINHFNRGLAGKIFDDVRRTGVSYQQFSRDNINLRLDNVALVLTALNCKFEEVFEIVVLPEI